MPLIFLVETKGTCRTSTVVFDHLYMQNLEPYTWIFFLMWRKPHVLIVSGGRSRSRRRAQGSQGSQDE